MSALFRVHYLKAGRNVLYTRFIPHSNFSYIILGLDDGNLIVVIRRREMVGNKIRSLEVVDIKVLTCSLSTCYDLIKKNELNHFKEITNEFIKNNLSA